MIETKRLLIRDHRVTDWKRIHLYASLPDFSQYDTWGPNTEDETKRHVALCMVSAIEEPRYRFSLAVCEKDNNQLIGGGCIHRLAEFSGVALIGYSINPNFQGKGFATEVAGALLKFGFDNLGLALIFATCDVRNGASYRVMENSGMRRVGLLKGDKEIRGQMRDSYRYEILSTDHSI